MILSLVRKGALWATLATPMRLVKRQILQTPRAKP
jgi:hypothetical protein